MYTHSAIAHYHPITAISTTLRPPMPPQEASPDKQLHLSALQGNLAMLKKILDSGQVDVDVADKVGIQAHLVGIQAHLVGVQGHLVGVQGHLVGGDIIIFNYSRGFQQHFIISLISSFDLFCG